MTSLQVQHHMKTQVPVGGVSDSILAPVAAGVGAALVIAVAVNVLIWYRVMGTHRQKTKGE